MKKRILIASGGTGGHFYPGYALGRELSDRGWEILFLVRKNGLPRFSSFPAAEVDIVGFPREILKRPLSGIIFFQKLVSAYFYVRRIVLDWQPAAVVGMGGYLSFPAVLAARMLNIPSIIHESNAKLGLSNRLCSMFASRMALGLPITGLPASGNIRLTGTPIRDYFRTNCSSSLSRQNLGFKPSSKTVLVFGGSQGARNLNLSMVKVAQRIVSAGSGNLQFLHIAGRRDYRMVLERYEEAGLFAAPHTMRDGFSAVKVLEYSDEMDKVYAAADIVICRSGASTIAELIHLKKPAILVPFPFSAGGHQNDNARILENAGAAIVVRESPALSDDLHRALGRALSGNSIHDMKRSYEKLDVPDPIAAASRLADYVCEITEIT